MLTKYGVKPNDAVLAGAANGGNDEQLKVYEVRIDRPNCVAEHLEDGMCAWDERKQFMSKLSK